MVHITFVYYIFFLNCLLIYSRKIVILYIITSFSKFCACNLFFPFNIYITDIYVDNIDNAYVAADN